VDSSPTAAHTAISPSCRATCEPDFSEEDGSDADAVADDIPLVAVAVVVAAVRFLSKAFSLAMPSHPFAKVYKKLVRFPVETRSRTGANNHARRHRKKADAAEARRVNGHAVK